MKKFIIVFLAIFICATTAYAEITWQKFEFFDNDKGLNDGTSPENIDNAEASDLQNIVFLERGGWETRGGYTPVSSPLSYHGQACTGLTFFKQSDGTRFLVGIFADDKIRKANFDTGGGVNDDFEDDITGSLSFDVSQNDLASFTVGEDTLIIEDGLGSTTPYKWAGTGNAVALGGSPPKATMVAFHKNMAFAAGNEDAPSTLYFSDLGDIENWTTGISGNVSVETNDGSNITAIEPGFDALYIWKDTSIWRLSGSDKDSFVLQQMVAGIGTLSKQSVSRIGNSFMFQDGQGDTYLYDGAVGIRKISNKIQGTIDGGNFARFQYVSTVEYQDDFYSNMSSVGTSIHDEMIIFDTFPLAWTKFDAFHANAMVVAPDDLGEDKIFFGNTEGMVFEYPDGTNDNETAISMFWDTKQFRFPQFKSRFKDWTKLIVYADQASSVLMVETKKDFDSSGIETLMDLSGETATYDIAIYDVDKYGGQNIVIKEIEPELEATFFQVKYSNSIKDNPITFRGYQMYIDPSDNL